MDTTEFLLAEAEIRRLLARYPRAADDRDGGTFANLFTSDGVVRVGGETFTGRDAIRDWIMAVTAGARTRHLMVNHLIEVESSTSALVHLDMALLAEVDGAWSVQGTARYSDALTHTDEGWLFAEREIELA